MYMVIITSKMNIKAQKRCISDIIDELISDMIGNVKAKN